MSMRNRPMKTLAPRFVCLALLIAVPSRAGAQELEGERLFRQRCASCHTLQQGQNRIAPHLARLVGRAAGSVEGARYSDAMRRSGTVWDEPSLGRFLANPRQVVPGTTMSIAVPSESERQALIAFLKAIS